MGQNNTTIFIVKVFIISGDLHEQTPQILRLYNYMRTDLRELREVVRLQQAVECLLPFVLVHKLVELRDPGWDKNQTRGQWAAWGQRTGKTARMTVYPLLGL